MLHNYYGISSIIIHDIVILIFLIQSESNVQHILISDPKDGVTSYGLTEEGKKQAKEVLYYMQNTHVQCILVKAPVRVHYRKYCTRGVLRR